MSAAFSVMTANQSPNETHIGEMPTTSSQRTSWKNCSSFKVVALAVLAAIFILFLILYLKSQEQSMDSKGQEVPAGMWDRMDALGEKVTFTKYGQQVFQGQRIG
jgi:hypothetical protein